MARLCAGDRAPDFEAPSQTGKHIRLTDLLSSGPVVLFFYPKAMTPGCTKESCHFRDLGPEFQALNASRLGISADEIDAQARFAEKYDFDFPLLSDPDGTIARAYGAARMGPLFNKRTTFVIARDGTVLEVISSEMNMKIHADRALEVLRAHAPANEVTRVVKLEKSPAKEKSRRS